MKLQHYITACALILGVSNVWAGQQVKVQTPLYESTIDISSGQIVSLSLRKYTDDINHSQPYSIIHPNGLHITAKYFTPIDDVQQVYTAYESHTIGNTTQIVLGNSPYTPTLKRKYVFNHQNYDISITDTLTNNTKKNIDVAYQVGLSTPSQPKPVPMISSFKGFMYVDQHAKTHKHREQSVNKTPLFGIQNPKMLAYSDRFFSTAVSNTAQETQLQSIDRDDRIDMVLSGKMQSLPRAKSFTTTTTFYAGPISPININAVHQIPSLEAVLDYGFLTTISNLFFNLLGFIGHFIPNHGFAIIALTVLFRMAMYPLTLKVERTNQLLKMLQPQIDEIKESHTPEQSQVLVKALLSENKANPLMSVLIPIIQIPIFMSILWMLVSNSELRDAPWVLWITDLSSPDPLMILPGVFATLLFLQSKLFPPANMKEHWKFAISLMPITMFVVFSYLPVGIVLYAITNTIFTMSARLIAKLRLTSLHASYAQ